MQIFSILQQNLLLQFPAIAGEPAKQQSIEFSHDPDDSSIVRLRLGPMVDPGEPAPYGTVAIEIEFDRNGRIRRQRQWPVRYPAWDTRSPDDIDAEIVAHSAEPAEEAAAQKVVTAAMADVPDRKFRGR